jgi:hypothetical protein
VSSKGILPTQLVENGIAREIINAVENAAAVSPTSGPIPAPTPAPAPEPSPQPRVRRYCINIFPGESVEIDKEFAEDILALEEKLGMPLWILAPKWNRGLEQHRPCGF